jgi:hypothetical protein
MDPIPMPAYRIHRLKDHLRQQFRAAPHVIGTASIKPGHYEPGGEIDASTPYSAFFQLRDAGTPLQVGDLLEAENGALRICKFVGFEEANWVIPDVSTSTLPNVKPEGNPARVPDGTPAASLDAESAIEYKQ